jgi:hypothetical protein
MGCSRITWPVSLFETQDREEYSIMVKGKAPFGGNEGDQDWKIRALLCSAASSHTSHNI